MDIEKMKNSSYLKIIQDFDVLGEKIYEGDRNILKKFELENGEKVVIKCFKKPNFINQFVYGNFRASKAKRSYFNAKKLEEIGVKTPKPLLFLEEKSILLFGKSYYVCEYVPYDYTIRKILDKKADEESELVLKQYAQVMFLLHQKKVTFIDNTPGNFLVKKENNQFQIYLVDLNRMKFDSVSKTERIKNLAKITDQKEHIDSISTYYAELCNWDVAQTKKMVWEEVQVFQNGLKRKKVLKRELMFWRK